jgi:hypothetical protein
VKFARRNSESETLDARSRGAHLVRDLALARDIARAHAAALASDLGRARSLTKNVTLTAAGSRNLIRTAHSFAVDIGHLYFSARRLDQAVADGALSLDYSRALTRQLVIDMSLAAQRACGFAYDTSELVGCLHAAGKNAEALVLTLDEQASPVESAVVAVRVSKPARWVMTLALRALPVMERSRYAEEWRSELWDLAEGPGSQRRQVIHALRTMACAVPQRSSIRQGRRRAAAGGG